jgi:hypothetical protein
LKIGKEKQRENLKQKITDYFVTWSHVGLRTAGTHGAEWPAKLLTSSHAADEFAGKLFPLLSLILVSSK